MFGRVRPGKGWYNDGNDVQTPRGDNSGAVMVSQHYPPLYELTMRNQAFIYHVASAALVILSNATGFPTIINPEGSGVLWTPTRLAVSWISGTLVAGSLIWTETLNCGTGVATAAPIITGTRVAPRNARRNVGAANLCEWYPSAITFTAVPVAFMATGISFPTNPLDDGAAGNIDTLGVSGVYSVDYHGEFAVEPGNAVSLNYSVTTSTAVFQITICGVEIPIVN